MLIFVTFFCTALASSGSHRYTLGKIADRTHANWEKKLTTPPLESKLKDYQASATVYRDQGWGNQKSQVRVALYDKYGKVKATDDLFGIAPHRDAPGSVMASMDKNLQTLSQPGDTLSVETYVGGGGGHVLYLEGFQMTVKQMVKSLKRYQLAAINDNSHENWEIKLETAPLTGQLLGYTATVEQFNDQGWGNQKSHMRVVLRDSQGDVKATDDLFGVAPHRDAGGPLLVENDWNIASKASPGDYLTVETYVGGGGGHSIHVKDFELTVRQMEVEQCMQVESDVDYPGGDLNAGGLAGRIRGHLSNAEECRMACEALPACVGYTFVKSEPSHRDNCAVKSRFTSAMRRPGKSCCDSGVPCRGRRRAEFEEEPLEVTIEELPADDELPYYY